MMFLVCLQAFPETIDVVVDLLFEHNAEFKITKNELKKLLISQHQELIFFLMVVFMTKLMV